MIVPMVVMPVASYLTRDASQAVAAAAAVPPPQAREVAGEDAMRTKQISIFVDNRPGRLASVARVLQEESIDIRAISMADAPDFGIFRVVVEETDRAGRP